MKEASELRALAPGEVERLAVLARVSRAINRSYNVDDTLSAAMDVVVEALLIGRGCIMLGRPTDPAPQIVVARGIDMNAWLLDAFEYSRTVVARVWQSGESLLCNDVLEDRRLSKIESLRKLRTRSLMCVPMRVRGQTTGVIYADNEKRANLFSPTDLRLLEIIADLAAAAVERARYFVDLNLQGAPQLPAGGFEWLGRQARGIAHDFSNIASIVRMNSEAALSQLGQGKVDEVRASIEAAKVACSYAYALSRLLVACAEPSPPAVEQVDVNRVLVEMEPLLKAMTGSERALVLQLGGGSLQAAAISMEVEQIVLNLVMNARNAMPEGGRLLIETALEAGPAAASSSPSVRITVTDTGVGLDEQDLQRIARGTPRGVGLKVVNEILQRRNGAMRVLSTAGSGARFDIYLPAASAAVGSKGQ